MELVPVIESQFEEWESEDLFHSAALGVPSAVGAEKVCLLVDRAICLQFRFNLMQG